MLKYQKVGGLHFVRVGRLGGSVFIARKRPARKLNDAEQYARAVRITTALDGLAIALAMVIAGCLPALILALT